MTRLPNLDDLRILVLVARTGSLGRAADELGMAQPSVSRRMAGLERTLKVPLLSRSRRGSTLTPSGRVIVDWAAGLLAAADRFSQSVAALAAQKSVTVRAAVSMTIAEHHAPVWVAQLTRTAPEAVVSLMVHNSTEVAQLVESGAADVGFLESPTVRRSLHRRRVAWDHLVVAVAPGHEWADKRRRVSAAELGKARPLVREPGSGTRETLESALARKGIELSAGLVMGSNAALTTAALAGMGPVVLSEVTLADQLSSGQLVRVDVDDLDLRRPLSAVWRRDEPLPEGVLALLKVATESPLTAT
jgi:DNA-binding transcriptional LysR family regulator